MGITKLEKGSNKEGTVRFIMGCETGKGMERLKAIVQTKLSENFKVMESS